MPPSRTRIAVLTTLVVAACDPKPPQAPPSDPEVPPTTTEADARPAPRVSTAFPLNNWSCGPETARKIERWTTAWRSWRGYGPPIDDRELVEIDAARVEEGFRAQVWIATDSLAVRDHVVTLDTMNEEIYEIDMRRKREQDLLGNEPAEPMSYGIGIEPDVSFGRVVDVLERLPLKKGDELAFLFAAPPIPPDLEPMPEDLRARIKRLLPGTDSAKEALDYTALRDAFREATTDCPPLRRIGNDLERAFPDERRRILVEELGDRWVQCECNADLEFILGFYHSTKPGRPTTSVSVVPDPDGTVLARVPEMKWAEIARRLTELRGKPVCIESDSETTESPLICASGAE